MHTRTWIALGSVAAGILTLTACSAGAGRRPAARETPCPAPEQTAGAIATDSEAARLAKDLAQALPTVTLTAAYTEATDPSGEMGKPHQYTSRSAFSDVHVRENPKWNEVAGSGPDVISCGGTIEVFATDDDAEAWVDAIDKQSQVLAGLIPRDHVLRKGRYVIRASHLLTASQAGEYKAALIKLR
jgi:hypothetical protein